MVLTKWPATLNVIVLSWKLNLLLVIFIFFFFAALLNFAESICFLIGINMRRNSPAYARGTSSTINWYPYHCLVPPLPPVLGVLLLAPDAGSPAPARLPLPSPVHLFTIHGKCIMRSPPLAGPEVINRDWRHVSAARVHTEPLTKLCKHMLISIFFALFGVIESRRAVT